MSGTQLYLLVMGPVALLTALGLAFWLKKRDDAEQGADRIVDRPAAEVSTIDPELGQALGYAEPGASLQSKTKG